MKYLVFGAATAAAFAVATPLVAQNSQFTLGVYGGAMFGASTGHQHFGPGVFAPNGADESDTKGGTWGAITGRFDMGQSFIGFGVEHLDHPIGVPFTAAGAPVEMGIRATVFDLEYGRAISTNWFDGFWTIGVRHGEMTFQTDNFAAGSGPIHEFEGTGIRVGLETNTPLPANGWSLWGDAGLSVLDGDIQSAGRGGWISTAATPTTTTAFGLDVKVAATRSIGNNTSVKIGYQAQLWDGVNVGISDNNGVGLNVGTSGFSAHGPFLGVSMGF